MPLFTIKQYFSQSHHAKSPLEGRMISQREGKTGSGQEEHNFQIKSLLTFGLTRKRNQTLLGLKVVIDGSRNWAFAGQGGLAQQLSRLVCGRHQGLLSLSDVQSADSLVDGDLSPQFEELGVDLWMQLQKMDMHEGALLFGALLDATWDGTNPFMTVRE